MSENLAEQRRKKLPLGTIWVEKAPRLGVETDIWSLAVFNNKLYGGTFYNGKLYMLVLEKMLWASHLIKCHIARPVLRLKYYQTWNFDRLLFYNPAIGILLIDFVRLSYYRKSLLTRK